MISPTTEPLSFSSSFPDERLENSVWIGRMNDVPPTEAVGMALLTVSKKIPRSWNYEVKRLLTPFSPSVAREINFYLSLNRHGRMLLRPPGGTEAPSGLWPRVLKN
jgi:hypothetical protein